MPVSRNFLAGLLPAASGYFAPQASIPQPGDLQSVDPGVSSPEVPDAGPAASFQPAAPMASVNPGIPVGLEPAGPPVAPPPAGPPLPPAGPPLPPEAPQPKLIAARVAGTPGHEVSVAGQGQKKLIGEANELRQQGVQQAGQGLVAGNQTAINAIQKGIEQQDALIAGARARQAQEAQQLDQARNDIAGAVKQRSEIEKPTDYWADKGVAGRIGAALALAAGAFGASLGHTQNGAQQMLQADMDRDLKTKQQRYAQQKDESDAKIGAGQANFNNLVRQFGMNAASDIEAAAQRNRLALEAQKLGAEVKIPELQGQYANLANNLMADAKDYEAKSMTKYVPPTAGGTQYIDPNIGIPMNRAEALKWRQEQEKEGTAQAGRVELQALKGAQKTPRTQQNEDTNRRFIAEKLQTADVPGTLTAIDDTKKAMQKSGDKGLGLAANAIWNHGSVGRKVYKQLYGADAANREQLWQTTVNKTLKSMSGVAVSPSEMTRLQAQLEGAHDPESRQLALQEADKTLRAAQNNVFAGAGQQATAEYQQNLAAQQPGRVQFTPVSPGGAAPDEEPEL